MMNPATVVIFDESNRPLVCLYRARDGEYGALGLELQAFLSEMVITSIASRHTKSANGMGCLAAQIVAHFKTVPGTFYLVPVGSKQAYNYTVKMSNGRLTLWGTSDYEPAKQFRLYSDEIVPIVILRRVQFVYDKEDGEGAKWRIVDVTDEDGKYITGFEGGKIKRFLVRKIVGGRILPA